MKKSVNPVISDNWKIIPEEWAKQARKKEYPLLFGSAELVN